MDVLSLCLLVEPPGLEWGLLSGMAMEGTGHGTKVQPPPLKTYTSLWHNQTQAKY